MTLAILADEVLDWRLERSRAFAVPNSLEQFLGSRSFSDFGQLCLEVVGQVLTLLGCSLLEPAMQVVRDVTNLDHFAHVCTDSHVEHMQAD
jgi:hypothetical protein